MQRSVHQAAFLTKDLHRIAVSTALVTAVILKDNFSLELYSVSLDQLSGYDMHFLPKKLKKKNTKDLWPREV